MNHCSRCLRAGRLLLIAAALGSCQSHRHASPTRATRASGTLVTSPVGPTDIILDGDTADWPEGAVIASNDGTAGGVVAALRAQNMVGVPVSGQDGDIAALNRIAKGMQTVSVWKDARALGKAAGTFAAQLADGTKVADIPGAKPWTSPARKVTIQSVFLKPIAITRDNLKMVIDADWATKEQVCLGVEPAKAPPACK